MNNAFYFVVDENYIPMAAAQAFVLASYNKFDVHIFIERKDKAVLPTTLIPTGLPQTERIHYHFDELSGLLPDVLPESQKWPRIVYLRIFVPQVLNSYSRLVYLDADVAIVDDPSELFEFDVPYTLAAVHDYGILGDTIIPFPGLELTKDEWLQGIGLEGCRYFNSGMLLINTEEWNRLDFRKLLQDYFDQYGHRVTMFDQDFLNYTFKNNWMELSPRWNFQASIFDYGFEHIFKPVVVHFTAPLKPWNGDFYSYQRTYLRYFTTLYDQLGIRISQTPHKLRRRNIKRIKTFIRRTLMRVNVQSKRERSQREKWATQYNIAKTFLRDALDNKQFADVLGEPVFCEPKILFDGHFVRTENLKATLVSLFPPQEATAQHRESSLSNQEKTRKNAYLRRKVRPL